MPTSSSRPTTTTTTRTTSFGDSTPSSSSEPPSLNRRGRFVNTVRGSGVPDISLDDLAIELFSSSDFGRVSSSLYERNSVAVVGGGSNNCSGDGVSDGGSRRRRSLSVASTWIYDSQRNQKCTSQRDLSVLRREKPSSQQRGLRRCSSQKDLLRSQDGYSSYSSTLTDDEGNDVRHITNGVKKKLNYVQTMAQNFDSVQSAQSDVLKTIPTTKRSYRTQLEQSEKRKQELLAEIVGESHPNSKEIAATRRPTRGRKRSKDVNKKSKQLVEDADKIIEEFISSFEETDMSSFDGERSDTSSIIGGTMKPIMHYGNVESFKSPLRSDLVPAEMDGVVLPWLKWETSNDATPLLRSDANHCHASAESARHDAKEELAASPDQEQSVNTKSIRGSWSPGVANSFTLDMEDICKTGDVNSCKNQLLSQVPRRSQIDIDDYLKPPSDASFLLERWKYRERMNSGGLVICQCGSLGKYFI